MARACVSTKFFWVSPSMPVATTHNREPKFIPGEELAAGVERFLILELGGVLLVEKLLGRVCELLGRALRQLFNFIFCQLGGIFVAAALEISAQKEVVLQRVHVLFEISSPGLRLPFPARPRSART